jgi:predicted secreted protein
VNASLALIDRPTGRKNELGMREKMFELDLLAGGKRTALQKDTELPKGRSGAYLYSIVAAYVNGNKVAAFVSYERPGFEGPDRRQMIVTGALPR